MGQSIPNKLWVVPCSWTEQEGCGGHPAASGTHTGSQPLSSPWGRSLADALSFNLATKCQHPTPLSSRPSADQQGFQMCHLVTQNGDLQVSDGEYSNDAILSKDGAIMCKVRGWPMASGVGAHW